jgi:CubicO group peptidase (beta-lactamase class C family)
MKALKSIAKLLLVIFIFTNLAIVASGKTYIYKAFKLTYMKGKSSADIDNYLDFDNRVVKAGVAQPWNVSKKYNTKSISEKHLSEFQQMQTIAFLVVKNDSIVHEQYWEGYNENSLSNSFSMGKSIVSMLIGTAIDEGKIKNEEQYVYEFLPEFKEGAKSKITIKHLLTMSSGIDFDESYKNPLSYTAEAYFGNDIKQLTLKRKAVEEPGKVWNYLSGNTELLALILEKATGKTLSDYASEKLWKPLGASNDALWMLDQKDGRELAYCCFNSNARDFARFGKLYLDSGKWNGRQIISSDYVMKSITPADLLDEYGNKNLKYGYQWWMIPEYKGHHVFYMRGILGQYILCIPDLDMIVVRLGHKRVPKIPQGQQYPSDVAYYLDAALEMHGK